MEYCSRLLDVNKPAEATEARETADSDRREIDTETDGMGR